MKYSYKWILMLAIPFFATEIDAQEYYLRFTEKDRVKVNSVITSTVSIDKVEGGTIYAYANPAELKKLISIGYKPEMLPHPSSLTRVINMATTVEMMSGWDRYPTYNVYRAMLKKFEQDYPTLCKLDSIGNTVGGRKLYVIKISDNVEEVEDEPEFFYTSTIHGDETTGFVLMLHLADYLLSNYGSDTRVDNLVNSMAIYINPNANPDGTYNTSNNSVSGATRYNANGYDLNRNFPDPRVGENPNGPYQPETVAMMEFAESRNFILSANFHGGIELVNYPWDAWTSDDKPHADHNWFNTISRQYADLVHANSPSGYFTGMNNGVTHGGDWYVVEGGRQDYMNYWNQCREVTIEISDTKLLSTDQLPAFWGYNRESMLTYMELVFSGIHGVVTNASGEGLNAIILIEDHDIDNSHVKTNPSHGNYYWMVEPGTWNVTYSAHGYLNQTHTVTIDEYNSIVTKDVVLESDPNGITIQEVDFINVDLWQNPVTNYLNARVSIQTPSSIRIELFSIDGQRLAVLYNGHQSLKEQAYKWDVSKFGSSVPKGLYVIRVLSGDGVDSQKVLFYPNSK